MNNEEMKFIAAYSLEDFLYKTKCMEEENEKMAYVFILEGDMRTKNLHIIKKIGNILKESMGLVVLVINTTIDFSFIDCMLSADICMATNNGVINMQSHYRSSGLYTFKQIRFLLGDKLRKTDWFHSFVGSDGRMREGKLIKYFIEDNQDRETLIYGIRNYMEDILIDKDLVQIQSLKSYYNLFKTACLNVTENKEQSDSMYSFYS